MYLKNEKYSIYGVVNSLYGILPKTVCYDSPNTCPKFKEDRTFFSNLTKMKQAFEVQNEGNIYSYSNKINIAQHM